METETNDKPSVVDGDCSDPFVLRQEVVISVKHITKLTYECIVTPCSILEYHVEHKTITIIISFFMSIVFPSNHLFVK